MKKVILLLAALAPLWVIAQSSIVPSDTLRITGAIKAPRLLVLKDIHEMEAFSIPDIVRYNHRGEARDTLTQVKGIPLQSVLAKTEYVYDNPRELNQFYFILKASDGYSVVFSWNEIYNSEAGKHFYIITQIKDKKLEEMENRILFISTDDLTFGRRYIKSLSQIEIKKVSS